MNEQGISSSVEIDCWQASVDSLLVVAFPKSKSKNFPMALSIARSAGNFGVAEFGNERLYVAVFSKTIADAGKAKVLLTYVGNWKGVLIIQGGNLQRYSYPIEEILSCYMQSEKCLDTVAHCCTVIDDPASPPPPQRWGGMYVSISIPPKPRLTKLLEIDRYLFPCRRLLSQFKFQVDHPASPHDQIQAEAVANGVAFCPRFDVEQYQKIGTRSIEVELS